MAESLEEREDQALYEVEHAIAEIIGPTEVGETGFYQMVGAQQHLREYREAIERRVRAEERQRFASLEGALREVEQGSPPDDWEPYEVGWWSYNLHGERGDADYVDAVDEGNMGDVHGHGRAVGRWEAAKIARQALAGKQKAAP